MNMIQIKEPHWHPINQLDSIRQFVMCSETRHVLENWGMKYLNIRIDMRTGNFMIKEGNTDTPSYLRIEK